LLRNIHREETRAFDADGRVDNGTIASELCFVLTLACLQAPSISPTLLWAADALVKSRAKTWRRWTHDKQDDEEQISADNGSVAGQR
jgi:hypothetical protein